MFDMAGGYSFIEKISESKYTTQYRVRREGDARTYIARSLASSYASPSDIALFKHAFEKVKSHSFMGAATLYDLIEYNNNYVIVEEDFSGVTLKEFIRSSRTQKKIDISSALSIGIALADVLSDFHGKGIIHMALRPDNIIYNEKTGDLRICGFGFENILTKEGRNLYYPGYIDNVLPYVSPEQTGRMNRTIDYRTDLYSLGVILYQLISGEVPFRSMDPLELIHGHIAREPLNLINCVPGIPQALSKIVMKLLAKNAEDRYQSGFGVKIDLSRCMRELAEHGSVDDFNIGIQDNSGRFQIPEKLYGRKEEIDRILSAFEKLDNGMSSLVVVAGEPGIGKTALINEIHKPVVERRGYFVSGKYEQYLKDRPYSAIILAFSRLIRQVLSEGDDRIDIWRNMLIAALGSNGRVISTVIPDLDMIIGEQPNLPDVGAAEQHNRFNMTFLRFIRVFANNDHPLVLFFDDLQWADFASVQLIRTMLSDPELKNILLVCTYRESDLLSAHFFKMMMQDLDSSYFSIYNISLANLLQRDVSEMVIDTFRCDEQKANELTEKIFEKTAGNPFFVREFLKNLFQEKIIQFSFDKGWQWDIGKLIT
jgi:serine/threonine protein kinase